MTYHNGGIHLNAVAILGPIAIVSMLADFILIVTWSPWYLTVGPVVLSLTRDVSGKGAVPSPDALERAATSFFLGRTLFRDFGNGAYAFRRSPLSGTGLLNGTLEFNPAQRTVTLVGRLGIFPGVFVAILILLTCLSGSLMFVGAAALIITVFVLLDYMFMQHVLSATVRVWSGILVGSGR